MEVFGTTDGTLVLDKGMNCAMRSIAFATTLAERGGRVVFLSAKSN